MQIFVSNEQNDLEFSESRVISIVQSVLAEENIDCDEVNVYLVSEEKITLLHEKYFNKPEPTDCISFPLNIEEFIGPRHLGEVVVCPKIAIEYAREHKISPQHEVTLYIVHGILHLVGYDDIDEVDKKEMRKAEKHHMNLLSEKGILDP
ncbi:MAG: rRNA maturation RNase YbeY [Chlamydiales bacterium]